MKKPSPTRCPDSPLMPKASAVWLIDNTILTFEQIADFCGLHPLEVQALADGEGVGGIVGVDPVRNRQLTQQELDRCIADPSAQLKVLKSDLPEPDQRTKGSKYTPLVKRLAKPEAVLWCLKTYPDLSDAQIIRLIGTTKPMITSIRTRSHWNMQNLQPCNPANVGLCTYSELQHAVEKAEQRKLQEKNQKAKPSASPSQ